MGKEKHNKKSKNSVFKVAGAKSLKVKNKAKPVNTQLKKISEINRKMIKDIDNQLVELRTQLTQPSKTAAQKTEEKRPLPSVSLQKAPVETTEATEKVCAMKL
ncbi:uncharacterized protein LOC124788668 [Schistocerca piceifrons]|uniref:uncharacterized protein LOC124788668 n=1 Tax=Schistocerca piceifrons TaxID=274613 RepID=UPI001F5F9BA0|nr:uncharacterized protein LOC124788668 [Schistocerca piceifrons]